MRSFEILGVFSKPEKFQAFVAKKYPRAVVGTPWRRGNGEWYLSTPQWEFVASPMNIEAGDREQPWRRGNGHGLGSI